MRTLPAMLGGGGSTVYRTKRRFVLGNLEAARSEEPRPGAKRKLSGKEQALLVATACSKPPAGRARWTLELLAGELVRLTEHASISRETVRRLAPKLDVGPHLAGGYWTLSRRLSCFAPKRVGRVIH